MNRRYKRYASPDLVSHNLATPLSSERTNFTAYRTLMGDLFRAHYLPLFSLSHDCKSDILRSWWISHKRGKMYKGTFCANIYRPIIHICGLVLHFGTSHSRISAYPLSTAIIGAPGQGSLPYLIFVLITVLHLARIRSVSHEISSVRRCIIGLAITALAPVIPALSGARDHSEVRAF